MEFFAKELGEATRNYCRTSVIGKGGYGVVYKGSLRYSTVAIKVLTPVSMVGLPSRIAIKGSPFRFVGRQGSLCTCQVKSAVSG